MTYRIAYKENGVCRRFRRSSFYDAICLKNKLLNKGIHYITIEDMMDYVYDPEMYDKKEIAKRRVKCVETEELFDNAKIAGKHKGCSDKTILKVLAKKPHNKTAGGYHWEYVYAS